MGNHILIHDLQNIATPIAISHYNIRRIPRIPRIRRVIALLIKECYNLKKNLEIIF